MSRTASRGVQCSPASSLFSSLNLRTSSSKTVPMAWLSMPGCFTVPSALRTGSGLRLISGSRNLPMSVPRESDLESVESWLRNLKFSRMSWTFWREAVQVVLEVGQKLLLAAPGLEVAQGEFGGVVEGLAGGGGEGGALLGDARLVEHLLGFEHGLLRRLQHGIHAAQDAHGQDDIGILAALEQVAEHVVGDAPDEGDDFVVGGLVHLACGASAAGRTARNAARPVAVVGGRC